MIVDKSNLIEWFLKNYPELHHNMSYTSHHYDKDNLSPHHLEGDVWTHTIGVTNSCYLNNDTSLPLACLLHDIGKTNSRTIDDEKKRVHFSGHEGTSFFMAIAPVMKYMEDFNIHEADFLFNNLFTIANHGYLYTLLRNLGKKTSQKAIERFVGREKNLNDIIKFSSYDREGSISSNPIDTNLIQNTFGNLSLDKNTSPTYDSTKPTAFIMVGLPGSGKSTYIKNNFPNIQVLSRDNTIMEIGIGSNYIEKYQSVSKDLVDKLFEEKKREIINKKIDFVYDLTNLSTKRRNIFINSLGEKYNVKIICLATDLEVALQRNKNRKGKDLSPSIIYNMSSTFSTPNLHNSYEIEWVFDNGHKTVHYLENNS